MALRPISRQRVHIYRRILRKLKYIFNSFNFFPIYNNNREGTRKLYISVALKMLDGYFFFLSFDEKLLNNLSYKRSHFYATRI